MASKFFKLTMLPLFAAISALSQEADSLIYAEGNIINAETKQPVSARIIYQSLPYGNKVGVINNAAAYSFPMFDGDRYSITVEASGYEPAKYLLDPAEANTDKKVIQNIELTVGNTNVHEVGQVMLLNNLIFQVGKSKLSSESYPELDIVVKMMQDNRNMVIQLEGHTDYQGDTNQNMKLSQQRVTAVKSYLVSKGINKRRIHTKAFGGTQPLSRDDTPEAHRMNRRVELRILKN